MNDFTKGVIVFTGGVISGLGIGVSYVTYLGLKNEKIHKAVVETVYDKIMCVVYGDSDYKPQHRENHVAYRRYRRGKQEHHPFTGELLFNTASELHQVLDSFTKIIEMYGQATVTDLYELCGFSSDYFDNFMGWKSVDDFKIFQNETSYMLKCPKPVEL